MVKNIETIPLDGGRLCFDFINTVESWKAAEIADYFSAYNDFLKWAQRVGASPNAGSIQLKKNEKGRPATAKALSKIREARNVLYRVFSAIADGSDPDKAVMVNFNKYIGHALARVRLQIHRGESS